jgi:hypothetical protein
VTTHHEYVRREIPRLGQFATKVVARHGADRPELPQIQQLIRTAGDDLLELASFEVSVFSRAASTERRSSERSAQAWASGLRPPQQESMPNLSKTRIEAGWSRAISRTVVSAVAILKFSCSQRYVDARHVVVRDLPGLKAILDSSS